MCGGGRKQFSIILSYKKRGLEKVTTNNSLLTDQGGNSKLSLVIREREKNIVFKVETT